MKIKAIQLVIVPVFALSACTDDDPNRKATPTQQSQTQVIRHQDGSYSRPVTAQVIDQQQLKTGRTSNNQPTSQPCQNSQTSQQGLQQQPCEETRVGGSSGSSSSTSAGNSQVLDQDHRSSSTTSRGFASRVSPDIIDSQRTMTAKSRGGFGASGSFGRVGG